MGGSTPPDLPILAAKLTGRRGSATSLATIA